MVQFVLVFAVSNFISCIFFRAMCSHLVLRVCGESILHCPYHFITCFTSFFLYLLLTTHMVDSFFYSPFMHQVLIQRRQSWFSITSFLVVLILNSLVFFLVPNVFITSNHSKYVDNHHYPTLSKYFALSSD